MLTRRPQLLLLVTGLVLLSAGPGRAAVLWDQSDFGTTAAGNASAFLPTSDFQLPQPATISTFTVWLADSLLVPLGGDGLANGVFTSFSGTLSWYVFTDNAGLPGALIGSGSDPAPTVVDTGVDRTLPVSDDVEDIFQVDGLVTPGLLLPAGSYWFGVREGVPGAAADDSEIVWMGANSVVGEFAKLFLDGANIADLNEAPSVDNAFVLRGEVAVPEPSGAVLVLVMVIGCAVLGRLAHLSPRSSS